MIYPPLPSPEQSRGAQTLFAHTTRAAPHRIALLGACLVGILIACGAEPEARSTASTADLDELYEAWIPVPLTETSDHQDAALKRKREVMERLRSGDRQLGLAALEAFNSDVERARDLDMALLEVAAHCAPEETLPDLEQLVLVFGADLGIRTQAAALLGETSPERARELLEPILSQPRGSSTYPPREALLSAWINASRKIDAPMDVLLVEIATSLFQPPEVRYLAIETLTTVPTPLAIRALEEVLVESSSDAYQRRKAAQAIRDGLPKEQACAILERVAERESDEDFILFLADMLEKHCF